MAVVLVEGDADVLLAAHAEPGWGHGFYEPKWTCPHYSLLELRDLAVARDQPACVDEVAAAIDQHTGDEGGFNPAVSVEQSDVCMNGMFLAFGCYFGADPTGLQSIVDFVLGQRLDDGGFNCRANRAGAQVSSVHSTTSVIEGLSEYLRDGYAYRAGEVRDARRRRERASPPPHPDGRWSAAAQYPGRAHLAYPPAGQPNRWITLRALRVSAWASS